ncbi:MAG: hypothetical protein FJ297_08050 [Planctomycetes bacterium]|nr:hypothetical protein [Planctomycetota bacterium]
MALLVGSIAVLWVLRASSTVWADDPVRVTLVAGAWLEGEGGLKATAPDSSALALALALALKNPFGVDFGPDGSMWIVELAGGRVHRLGSDGVARTVAGALGVAAYAGDGGPAESARFNGMHNVAVSKEGVVYVADTWNHRVRRIEADRITTLAGTGRAGYRGDGGPGREAEFNYVMCVTLSADERTLFIADLNNRRIRALDLSSGIVRLVAGNGEKGVPTDGAKAAEHPLVDPRACAPDAEGRVYILERTGHALRVVDSDGVIRTVAGTGKPGRQDGPGSSAQLNGPKHLALDPLQRVYIADEANNLIRRYDPRSGAVTTVLGDGTTRPAVRLKQPHGVCVERGALYVVDSGNDRILRIDGLVDTP